MPHFGWVVEKSKEYADKCRENAQQPEIACADGENAAEEKRWQVGHETWSKETADDAHTHAQSPEHGNGGVLTYVLA